MNTIILSKNQLQTIVFQSRKKIEEKIILDLRDYQRLIKTAENYGFTVDKTSKKNFLDKKNLIITKYNGAVCEISGDYTIFSSHILKTEKGEEKITLYLYQKTLTNKYNRFLARKAIKNHWVKLFPDCDEEYLYETLSDTADEIFYEEIKEKAKSLPIYKIKFAENGDFKIEEMGKII